MGWSACSGADLTDQPRRLLPTLNQMTVAIPWTIGIDDFAWQRGDLTFTGIAPEAIAAVAVDHGMRNGAGPIVQTARLGATAQRQPQRRADAFRSVVAPRRATSPTSPLVTGAGHS